jgi:hypothetical protein
MVIELNVTLQKDTTVKPQRKHNWRKTDWPLVNEKLAALLLPETEYAETCLSLLQHSAFPSHHALPILNKLLKSLLQACKTAKDKYVPTYL